MSKVILVTGANTGIGYELVRLLAQKGHRVYIAARNETAGQEAATKLRQGNLDVKYVHIDVTDIESIKAAKDAIEKDEGRLDVLVNNAAIGEYGKDQNATTVDVSAVRNSLEVNLIGLIQTTTTFLPLLRLSPQAVILNVSSELASNTFQASANPGPHFVAYNTSKAAVNSYTIALAHELKKDGIKVNAVTPGFTSTKLNNYHEHAKTPAQGAESLLPWTLLDKNGPTGQYFGQMGQVLPW
ncbi:hypothetical protein M378DRAFT_7779 [Amanita muscaria Koide BX008]|uniref:NAD(P)-binding protein n=1 Tax=Amanita muscaria (strain Koide BX008) TaxID=946122 RepID=A0A0C2TP99_AMAMK|nr:hypothetical protein M378DRAFT_7779 [Amanita muscaria Koide BX008]